MQAAPALYSRELLAVIDWMMAPEAGERPQNVDEVLGRLEPLQASVSGVGTERIAGTLKRKSPQARSEEKQKPASTEPVGQAPAPAEPVSSRAPGGRALMWIAH